MVKLYLVMATALPESISETIGVENVVTSSDVGRDLDLDTLGVDLPHSQFNPEDFPGLIYRSPEEKVAVLIFRSGKIICTGASSLEQTNRVIKEIEEKFDEIGLEHEGLEASVQNVVGTADFNDGINLNAVAIGLGLEKTEYEPEQFPGLIYRSDNTKPVVLIFGSGKIVITGGKGRDEIEAGVENVYNELTELSLV